MAAFPEVVCHHLANKIAGKGTSLKNEADEWGEEAGAQAEAGRKKTRGVGGDRQITATVPELENPGAPALNHRYQ